MTDFDYDFAPERVTGVAEIKTLGVSPDLLEQLSSADSLQVILAMGVALQKIAHPDKGSTSWAGPESSTISDAASRLKALRFEDFSEALTTFINNASIIRHNEFVELKEKVSATKDINTFLGSAVLDIIMGDGSKDVYAATNGLVFSNTIWNSIDSNSGAESIYRFRMQDGVVSTIHQLDRQGVLVEKLPKAYQGPLNEASELLKNEVIKQLIVDDNGVIYTVHDPRYSNIITKTDMVLPSDDEFPIYGSLIVLREAKSATKIKPGALIFSSDDSQNEHSLQSLVGSRYVGAYIPEAQKTELDGRINQRLIKALNSISQTGQLRQQVLSKDQLLSLIEHGTISLKRSDTPTNMGSIVLMTEAKNKPVAILAGERLTIPS